MTIEELFALLAQDVDAELFKHEAFWTTAEEAVR